MLLNYKHHDLKDQISIIHITRLNYLNIKSILLY